MPRIMTQNEADFTQVIEYLENDVVRVYTIVVNGSHYGDHNDPLTTIEIKGYKDVQA